MKHMLLFLLLSSQVFAAECYLFKIKGTVEDNNGFRIKIHEGTNSEKYFVFPQNFDLKMAIYQNRFVDGKFILKSKEPISGAEIIGIESTELAVPDPLFHHKEIIFQKVLPCPVTVIGKK